MGSRHSILPPTPPLVPRVFFDACDGLFVNYNWKEEHLERTRRLAGQRHADVYVGVDVFARGDVVGGGFDSHKVRVVRLDQSRIPGLPLVPGSELASMAWPYQAKSGRGGEVWALPGWEVCTGREQGDRGAAVPGGGDAAGFPAV